MSAGDRTRLERRCRYVRRSPLAQDSLELTEDGKVLVKLRRPWSDGTRAIRFEPSELLEKLAAMIPRPRANLLIYHGAFAPRGRCRELGQGGASGGAIFLLDREAYGVLADVSVSSAPPTCSNLSIAAGNASAAPTSDTRACVKSPACTAYPALLRVRLLHSSIRSWLARSPGFADAYYGTPLDQTMLAMTLSLFDYLNMRSMVRLGLPLSDDDLRAHHHMWRYVGYLIGIDEQLLTEDLAQERELWSALVAHHAFPELFGENYLSIAVDTVDKLVGANGWAGGTLRSPFLFLSGAPWFGVPKSRQRDPRVDLLWWVSMGVGSARSWIPGVSSLMESEGAARFAEAERMARTHGFGVKVERDEDNEDSEVTWQAMAAASAPASRRANDAPRATSEWASPVHPMNRYPQLGRLVLQRHIGAARLTAESATDRPLGRNVNSTGRQDRQDDR